MRLKRNRKLDWKDWISIKRELFNEVRGVDGGRYLAGFKLLAGFLRYANTSEGGFVSFDNFHHANLFRNRLGISSGTFRSRLNFLIKQGILFEKGRYTYKINLKAVKFVDSYPAEPEKKEKGVRLLLREGRKSVIEDSWVGWRRYLLNQEREDFLLLLRKEFDHKC